MNIKNCDNYNFYRLLAISFLLTFINILTVGKSVGAVFTLTETLIVYFFLFVKRNVSRALFWHMFFLCTAISPTLAAGLTEFKFDMTLYDYGSLKFMGPMSISYITTLIIMFLSLRKRKYEYSKEWTVTLKCFLFLAITGDILGFIGFAFDSWYNFTKFTTYNVYIWMVIATIVCVRNNNNQLFAKRIFDSINPLFCGEIIASAICFFVLGFSTTYGGLKQLPFTPDLLYYSPILIIGLLYSKKNSWIILISILVYFSMTSVSLGGKGVFILLGALLYASYVVFLDQKYRIVYANVVHRYRLIFGIGISCIVITIPVILASDSALTRYKIEQALSLFSGDFSEIADSPATRVAETANFFANNIDDPVHLLFGMGYGGYFTDELGLFNHLSLLGGYSKEEMRNGVYASAHDTFSVVPLLNGVVGFIIVMYVGWILLKRIRINYLSYAAVPWILLTFYFNPRMAFMAIFILEGAQYVIPNSNNLPK